MLFSYNLISYRIQMQKLMHCTDALHDSLFCLYTTQYFWYPYMEQASMSALHMRLLVRDYTLDKAQAKDPTPVDPSGLISFARQAPDADSDPKVSPAARSKSSRNKHSSLQVRAVPLHQSACTGLHDVVYTAVLRDLQTGQALVQEELAPRGITSTVA